VSRRAQLTEVKRYRKKNYWTVTFRAVAVAFLGSSSVSTPSAYFACALVSSTSWPRLNAQVMVP